MASKGNHAIYTAGESLFTDPPKSYIKVPPDTWVWVDTDTGLSIDNTATPATHPNIAIGLAKDTNGDGISDYIRWAYSSIVGAVNPVTHSAQPSNCAVAGKQDVYFGCIECGQNYTIEVHVTNPDTEAFGQGWAGSDIYSFSYTPPCGDCTTGDCPETSVSADQLMCGLYNVITGTNVDPNWDVKLNDFPVKVNHTYPFSVAKLYDGGLTTFEYCLSETDGECVDCVNLTDIGGFSSSTGSIDETFDPVTWVEEDGSKVSKRLHLERVADRITTLLAGAGTATLLFATGNCCTNHKLEINSCYTDIVLKDGDGNPISVCEGGNTNPFSSVTNYNECQDCDNENTTTDYTAGLRFFAHAVQGECDCVAANNVIAEYFSEIEVFPKQGFAEGGAKVSVKQYPTIAEGQGYTWQKRELETIRPLLHETFYYNLWQGQFGAPHETDVLNHVTVDCKKSYCVIHHKVNQPTTVELDGRSYTPRATVSFLIPTDDATTIASFLSIYNNYFSGSGLATLSCA